MAGILLAAVAQSAPPQDLGEAAAKEKARRKKVAGPATVYTNDDLDKGKPSPSPSPSPEVAPAPPAGAAAPPARGRRRVGGGVNPPPPPQQPPSGEVRPETDEQGSGPPGVGSAGAEAYWRGRADAARTALADAEKKLADVQARYDATRKVAGIQPLPIDALRQIPPNAQVKTEELIRAENELDEAKKAVDAARKAITALEEEARRKGAPPGWLRGR
jgi:hypothetical protein